jgi:hemerythrin-like domain-containing protein
MLTRRSFFAGGGLMAAGLWLGSRAGEAPLKEVTATEDLMREHGILRRILFVYSEAAARLRNDPSLVPADPLHRAASLFRAFGEEYHEKKLEEAFIFPAVKRAGGAAARIPDILAFQHERGREITGFILAVTGEPKTLAARAGRTAEVLEVLVRMYLPHASIEDTIIFPAWKDALPARELDAMNDRFEDIEHEQFGVDGFENAVREIGEIEVALGLGDLARFTAPSPPAL